MTDDTQQRLFSILRQLLAIAGVVMGVLTASVNTLHLPAPVSAVLVVAGGIILAIEHFVADPSTGTATVTTTTPSVAPVKQVVQVAPSPVPSTFGNAGAPTSVPVIPAVPPPPA
jgi:hypothetical protein